MISRNVTQISHVVDDTYFHNKYKVILNLVLGKETPLTLNRLSLLDRNFHPIWNKKQSPNFKMVIDNNALGVFDVELDLIVISTTLLSSNIYYKKEKVNLPEIIRFSNSSVLRRALSVPSYIDDISIHRVEILLDETHIFAAVGRVANGFSVTTFVVRNYDTPSESDFEFNVYEDYIIDKEYLSDDERSVIDKYFGFDRVPQN